mmetsp:Transcript_41386/g.99122  ORF Transcript_41386/g.99122 Transcript_41386/m.99122 type:complete len:650 (-) Transcript_41386:183-2132(-)
MKFFGKWSKDTPSLSSERSAFSLPSSSRSNFGGSSIGGGAGGSSSSDGGGGSKPLPLKQRTSSVSDFRDFSHNTWISLLRLIKLREYFISTDNFSIWRRHLAWAMEDGKDLRQYMTQRYASTMVFMSLLLSTELGVLFNSAKVTTDVRFNLHNSNHDTVAFWAGLLIIVSVLLTLLSLISTFTAWAMVSAVDGKNAHCVLRSSIGQYAAELPGRMVVFSIYSFLTSFMLFFFLLLPVGFWSILLLLSTAILFVHVISVFSCFGRIIMHTGAMGTSRIFSPEYEGFLEPHSLHTNLRNKAECNLSHSTSIMRQYRSRQQPIDRYLANDQEMYDHLSGGNRVDRPYSNYQTNNKPGMTVNTRNRSDSIVRFADEEQGHQKTGNVSSVNMPPDNSGGSNPPDRGMSSFKYGSISDNDPFRTSLTPLSEASHVSNQSSSFANQGFDTSPPTKTSENETMTNDRPPIAIFTDPMDDDGKDGEDDGRINPGMPRPWLPTTVKTDHGDGTNQNVGRHRSNVSSISNASNVSNVSLEQWLQGSSVEVTSPRKPNTNSSRMDGDGNGNGDDESNGESSNSDRKGRGYQTQQTTQSPNRRPNNTKNSTPMSLSESEQFDYDYGTEIDQPSSNDTPDDDVDWNKNSSSSSSSEHASLLPK